MEFTRPQVGCAGSSQTTTPLSPGTSLGPYSVTTKIGEGGIGQVWQATDTPLNRAADG